MSTTQLSLVQTSVLKWFLSLFDFISTSLSLLFYPIFNIFLFSSITYDYNLLGLKSSMASNILNSDLDKNNKAHKELIVSCFS